jgi:hypothetical protein
MGRHKKAGIKRLSCTSSDVSARRIGFKADDLFEKLDKSSAELGHK